MKGIPVISDAEWQVMAALWEHGPATAGEIVSHLEGRTEWKPTTVKTLLGRLVKKGAVAFSERGREYVYRPTVARDECVQAASRSFLGRVFGGSLVPMVAQLVETGSLSSKEIQALRQLLDQRSESPKRSTRTGGKP
jgi:BlaI family penicillinase repressor